MSYARILKDQEGRPSGYRECDGEVCWMPQRQSYEREYRLVKIDPATMEYIAKQIAVQQQKNEEAEAFIETFAKMKPKDAAKLFEADAMSDRLELVVEIMEGLSVEQRADILGAMNTELAAKLVKMMHPDP